MTLSKRKLANRLAYAESLSANGVRPSTAKRTLLQQNPSGALAQALDWERSVPRCETCRHVKKEQTLIHKQTNRLPVIVVPPTCKRGHFYTLSGAICKHWTGQDGSTLAQPGTGS